MNVLVLEALNVMNVHKNVQETVNVIRRFFSGQYKRARDQQASVDHIVTNTEQPRAEQPSYKPTTTN